MSLKEKIVYAIATVELTAFMSGSLYSFYTIAQLSDQQNKVYAENLKKKALFGAGIAATGLIGAVLRNIYSTRDNETSLE